MKQCFHLLPDRFVDNRVVLAFVQVFPVPDLSQVGRVRQ